jgi:hypothetical protein
MGAEAYVHIDPILEQTMSLTVECATDELIAKCEELLAGLENGERIVGLQDWRIAEPPDLILVA